MKKVFMILFAAAVSIASMAQFYVCKDGVVVYKIDDGVADSITFTEPNLSKVTDLYHDGTEAGYNYVDLGLTSGTKWATANVGADSPQDYGNYYAWGETTTKETYNENTYKYFKDGNYRKITKYCSDRNCGNNGFTDTKTILDLSDDAAYINWGGKWRMPTKVQQDELINECYWVWTESYSGSNVKGYIVYKAKNSSDKGVKVYSNGTPSSSYSLSDAHIFLSATGTYIDGDLDGTEHYANYISSSLNTDNPSYAWELYFYPDFVDSPYENRYFGLSVRAVISGE